MPFPIVHLPTLQNWDCHARGSCCKEYVISLTDEEKERIEKQGWDVKADLSGLQPFRRKGWFRRYWVMNHQADGSCVFLSDQGRCKIHEKHGYETKPLACRLYPFVLVPQGDRWGLSVRYACPSAAENLGRPIAQYDRDLREFAALLAQRAGLDPAPDGMMNPPPRLRGRQQLDWPDTRRFLKALLGMLQNRQDRFERRMRKCLALATLCRQASYDNVRGERLDDFLKIMTDSLDQEVPANAAEMPRPSWIGRILFRQALAIFTRKDHGPKKGPAVRSRWSLFRAAWRFLRGKGAVPRLHAWLPETTFQQIEDANGLMTPEVDEILERYYSIKVGSMQFCGPTAFGVSFWEGFETLAVTLPVLLWTARAFTPLPIEQGLMKALSIVDEHFGYNRVLSTLRQRLSFKIMARRGEIARLIAWYNR